MRSPKVSLGCPPPPSPPPRGIRNPRIRHAHWKSQRNDRKNSRRGAAQRDAASNFFVLFFRSLFLAFAPLRAIFSQPSAYYPFGPERDLSNHPAWLFEKPSCLPSAKQRRQDGRTAGRHESLFFWCFTLEISHFSCYN